VFGKAEAVTDKAVMLAMGTSQLTETETNSNIDYIILCNAVAS